MRWVLVTDIVEFIHIFMLSFVINSPNAWTPAFSCEVQRQVKGQITVSHCKDCLMEWLGMDETLQDSINRYCEWFDMPVIHNRLLINTYSQL